MAEVKKEGRKSSSEDMRRNSFEMHPDLVYDLEIQCLAFSFLVLSKEILICYLPRGEKQG